MPDLSALRARTGRPHWLIIDEAHHLTPAARDSASLALSDDRSGMIMITVHPDSVSPDALKEITAVAALGPKARDVIATICSVFDEALPDGLDASFGEDEVLFWRRTPPTPVRRIKAEQPREARKRHTRKYAEGRLGEEASFYFRGPKNEMNLRAHNLTMFLQIAEGIDDRTWEHHLRRGDYSKWFEERIGDEELAGEAAGIEEDRSLSPAESRQRLARRCAGATPRPHPKRVEPAPAAGVERTTSLLFRLLLRGGAAAVGAFRTFVEPLGAFPKVDPFCASVFFSSLAALLRRPVADCLPFAVGACSIPMAAIPP